MIKDARWARPPKRMNGRFKSILISIIYLTIYRLYERPASTNSIDSRIPTVHISCAEKTWWMMVSAREVKIEAVIERIRRNRCWSPGPSQAPSPSPLEPHRLNQEGQLLPNCSWRHIFSHYHTCKHHQSNSSNAGHFANFWKRSPISLVPRSSPCWGPHWLIAQLNCFTFGYLFVVNIQI